MKKVIYFFIVMIMVFLNACKKDECRCDADIYHTWEVMEFMSVESVYYAKDNNCNPAIEFREDGTLDIHLDMNQCFGEFILSGKDGISISGIACTEICCDSDFSVKFTGMLSLVESYSVEQSKMKLIVPGWGWIELKLVSD
jgi:heat shock protein HslJ